MSSYHAQRDIVLLVDDSPETLGMLTETLEQAGLTVVVARDGLSALSLLERVDPDVVLLDAIMPGIDGFETCRRLKEDPRFAVTPVIFMTGLSESADVVRGLEAGGVDYVTKPVDTDALVARISVHAANARVVAEARTALDAAGRAVLALDDAADVQWASPQAAQLAERLIDPETPSPDALIDWLGRNRTRPVSDIDPLRLADWGKRGLEVAYLARTAKGAHLVRIKPESDGPLSGGIGERFGLTPREAEVLAWLARGKSNRDIATILSLSPRTVTKHLEQIYAKLGVDNRTSAVAIVLTSREG
ncbi:MAG: DNA-binding response regulator [Pseudomonadota bacterium]